MNLSYYIKNPKKLFIRIGRDTFLKLMSDRKYIEFIWKVNMDYPLNLDNPKTFNEKLQWLKLYNRKPIYTTMVDKYAAKEYIASIAGDEYIIPTIGVWDKFDDIDFDSLPNQFVLKCTHDSGGLIICKDKSKLNIKDARKTINKSLKRNYYSANREWPYKNVKPRIIAEELIDDLNLGGLTEYKIFCFDGKAKMVDICKGKAHSSERTNDYCYADTLERLPFSSLLPNSTGELSKPKNYEKMVELAEKLSTGIPQIRMDFYNIDGNIYFGEMTFFHNSGMCKFNPEEWDYKLGEWINLPNKKED